MVSVFYYLSFVKNIGITNYHNKLYSVMDNFYCIRHVSLQQITFSD
jgi:hypothetical protein